MSKRILGKAHRLTCFARRTSIVVGATLACLGPLHAQTPDHIGATRENYARAEALLRNHVGELILNEYVIPHWLSKSDQFWYLHESAQGHDFVLVDAATGRKQPAFDHKAIAAAIATATGTTADSAKLPFKEFEPIGSGTIRKLRATIAKVTYECTVQPARCDKVPDKAGPNELVSPDGQLAAFTRDGNLWLRDPNTGAERALTNDGSAHFGYGIYPDAWQADYVPRERGLIPTPPFETYWSPDSKRLIVSRSDQRHVAEYPFVETAPADGSFRPKLHSVRIALIGEKQATVEWFVFDVVSGERRRIELPYAKLLVLQQDMVAIRRTWWSPANDRLFAVAFGDNMESAFLFDINVASGSARTVIEEHLLPRTDLNTTSYNPPNVRVTANGQEAIWFSQQDGWGHLYLYDVRTGKLKNRITHGNWLVRDIVHIDEARRQIYFTAGGREPGNPYYRYLYRTNFDGTQSVLLSPEPGDHPISSPWNDVLQLDGAIGYEVISPSGRFAVYTTSPMTGPTRTVIRRTADAKLVATIEETDFSRLLAAGYRPPEEFVAKAADGTSDLYGVVYKPSDFDPTRKYPVIDVQYASPLTAVAPRNAVQAAFGVSSFGTATGLAQLGFITVSVDGRGTTFRSREFTQAGYGKLNVNGLDDHVAAIQQLAQRFPYLDAQRVGIVGASYGGWSAIRGLLEFPDFYKVGVAGVPPASMHNMYIDYHWTAFQGRPRYSDGSETRGSSTEIPANWLEADGTKQVAKLKGKLLMIMGELDENVPPGTTLQFVDALIKADRDFELIYLPNTNHRQTRAPYTVRRTWDFFVRHLQGVEPPKYEIGGPSATGR